MSKLFISYRRDDSADICGRLDDKLAAHFGRTHVFKDVDSVPLGADFREVLRNAVSLCAVMLVVIGRRWVEMTDAQGLRRLDNPADYVRIEVEAALARDIPVIPVLVQGATVPREDQLPPSMASLAYRHGFELHGDPYFHRSADQLINRLTPLLQPAQPAQPTLPSAITTISSKEYSSLRRTTRPPRPSVTPNHHMPGDRFTDRLAKLGFIACQSNSVEYILPPLCDIPPGPFLMGSDKHRDSQAYEGELPQHTVILPAFQIARYPVTVAEYACFVRANHAKPGNWLAQLSQSLDRPVTYVSWHDVTAYATWLTNLTGQRWRLPTEAEWEKAARGPDGFIFPWNNIWDSTLSNTSKGGQGGITPIGTYPQGASPYGAQDMVGNVWEWTNSLYKPYPYRPNGEHQGGDPAASRVLRGGSWLSGSESARAACRLNSQPDARADFIGFRLCRAAPIP